MQERALVDWGSEDLLEKDRKVDDWTAGDDLDFTVRNRRRRITGEHAAVQRPATAEHDTVRPRTPARAVTIERDVPPHHPRAVGTEDRRTVAITGRPDVLPGTPRLREVEARRRPTRSPVDHAVSRPDRIALYAVGLGFVLILIAALSGGA